MTRRKEINYNSIQFGKTILNYRKDLTLKKNSREYFLKDRENKGLIEEKDISIETLKNIENGLTIPSLKTLKILSIALEVDFIQMVKDLEPYIS